MTLRIPRSDFEHLAPASPGFIRVVHNSASCSGDSKSLKITRKDDGSIDAHCFRCGGVGWIGGHGHYVDRSVSILPDGESILQRNDEGYALPKDLSKNPAGWPKEVRTWLSGAGLTQAVIKDHGMQWSEYKQTLYIPVIQETMALGPKAVGWVLRRFHPKRYLTLAKDKTAFWGLLRRREGPSGSGTAVILVEDMISALRTSEIRDTIALLGVNLRPGALNHILEEGYSEAVVFLDGDNPQVKMHARKIARALSFIPTRIVETGKDPKEHALEELKALLDIHD